MGEQTAKASSYNTPREEEMVCTSNEKEKKKKVANSHPKKSAKDYGYFSYKRNI